MKLSILLLGPAVLMTASLPARVQTPAPYGVILRHGPSLAFVSDTAVIQSQVRSRQAIISRIRGYETSALVEAEQSGDRTLVPIILAQLFNGFSPGMNTRDILFVTAARHALAALADRRQLQEIWCNAVKEDDLNPSVSPLGFVGGWFGIRGLQELLK